MSYRKWNERLGGTPPPPPPPPPSQASVAAMAERRQREREANERAMVFVKSHTDAIAFETYEALTAIQALSDEKVLAPGLLQELNGRVQFAKTRLRGAFRAVSRYHSAIRAHIDSIRTTSDAGPSHRTTMIRAHLQGHGDIGVAVDSLLRAWTASCRRMKQNNWEPLLADPIRHDQSCRNLTEFLTALVQRHESIGYETQATRGQRPDR